MAAVRQELWPVLGEDPLLGIEGRDRTDRPAAPEILVIGLLAWPVKRITSSWFQVPPRPAVASARICGVPPLVSTFLSLPVAKNPMNRPSGDQNGNDAPSVPANGWAWTLSSGRTQICDGPPFVAATKARCCPSGESASCAAEATGDGRNATPVGVSTSNRTAGAGAMSPDT